MAGSKNLFKIGTDERFPSAEIDLKYPGGMQLLHQIKRSNIRNHSIDLREPENLLSAYYEYPGTDHRADRAAMAADPVTQDWWKVCMPMQAPLATKTEGEWWAGMEEVFHLD